MDHRQKRARDRHEAVQEACQGTTIPWVARKYGFSRTSLHPHVKRAQLEGPSTVPFTSQGGPISKLSPTQKRVLGDLILNQQPWELLSSEGDVAPRHLLRHRNRYLWTRTIIRDLIRFKFRTSLTQPAVGSLLKEIGLEPLCPLSSAFEPEAERGNWIQRVYPAHRRKAKTNKERLLFVVGRELDGDWSFSVTDAQGSFLIFKTPGAFEVGHFLWKMVLHADRRFLLLTDNLPWEPKNFLEADPVIEGKVRLLPAARNQVTSE